LAEEARIALFIDFENLALGLQSDNLGGFDVQRILDRLLDKGRIIVKRSYADWKRYTKNTASLHEAGIELIQIPQRRVSGKNSADIRLVVDALDLCYTKEHLDTFVIASGDSDFAPLVNKLRENNKTVIGVGLQKSTSRLLSESCDEFLYYEEIGVSPEPAGRPLSGAPDKAREAFARLLEAILALQRENKGVLWSSLVKDTMKRKWPDFSEGRYGYHTFSELLEEAEKLGLIGLTRDMKSGGTYVVTAVHTRLPGTEGAGKPRRRAPSPKSGRTASRPSA
jgi:uncharacterized protein (TIGR00288 family)